MSQLQTASETKPKTLWNPYSMRFIQDTQANRDRIASKSTRRIPNERKRQKEAQVVVSQLIPFTSVSNCNKWKG